MAIVKISFGNHHWDTLNLCSGDTCMCCGYEAPEACRMVKVTLTESSGVERVLWMCADCSAGYAIGVNMAYEDLCDELKREREASV